jgi:uncharacterized repeat protein (TIGR04076 family)
MEKMEMRNRDTVWDTAEWQFIKIRLGYTNEEIKLFRNNPRNEEFPSRVINLMNKNVIATVVESHGCNSQHKVGDKFYFDGFGNLLTERCPKRICIYALNAIVPQIFAVNELLLADVDPNQMRFNHAACFDVGVQCGGVGQIAMEIKIEDGEESQ